VHQYVTAALHKSDRERSELQKDKTGVFTGEAWQRSLFSSHRFWGF